VQLPGRVHAELELGVGDDDAARERVVGGGPVEADRGVAHLAGARLAHHLRHALEGDVLVVVARLGLGGGSEDRLRAASRRA
jgi:hypothetical protein